MNVDYALRFGPNFRRYIWGGRRLETSLGKTLEPGDDYAENWEIVDRGADQSVVACGPLAGTTLGDLVRQHGRALMGQHHGQGVFPLILKFLDARKTLSVQVHPDDRAAATLDPPDLGKTEAWVVIEADEDSLIYAGLRQGVDRTMLAREVARGATEQCLHRFRPQVGDCIFLPAGVVHAIGAGLVVAEIQQASDTTFRLFDWNRRGKDGQPRQLHIEQSLEAIDYVCGPVTPQATDRPFVQRLVACDKFVLDRWRLDAPQTLGGDDRFHIVAVIDGVLRVAGDPVAEPLGRGQTMLLPAAAAAVQLTPAEPSVLLDMHLPELG